MGLAELPRAYFSGFTCWSPSTMNNNDSQPSYDPAAAALDWSWLERRGLTDPAEFDAYATQLGIPPAANDALLPGLDITSPPAEWNFYGDNSCGFVQADEPVIEWPAKFSRPPGALALTLSGYTAADGSRGNSDDPWLGQPVRLNAGLDPAKLVDVDPICPWSSQIFADTVTLGSAEAARGLTGATAGRAHSRWVFFARNLNGSKDVIIAGIASSMWQLALPADGLRWFDAGPQPGTLAEQLRRALARPEVRGLMIRFVTYHTVYFQGSAFTVVGEPDWPAIAGLYAEYAAAAAAYERGELDSPPPRPVNRAYSDTVGWIAPWTSGDMRSMAVGRTLHAGKPVQPLDPSLTATALGPAVLEYAADPENPGRVGRVALDLGSTIPELDSTLTKVDFGRLELALCTGTGAGSGTDSSSGGGAGDGGGAGGELEPFAAIDYAGGYDRDAYVASAGVVEIPASAFSRPLTIAELQARRLALTATDPVSGSVQVALLEAEYTAETDDRATYLNEPDAPGSSGTRKITIQVRHRGGKPPAGTRLRIAQYSPDPPGFNESAWQLVSEHNENASAQAPYLRLRGGGPVNDGAYTIVEIPHEHDGLPYGTAAISVQELRPGPPVLQLVPIAPGQPGSTPPAVVGFEQLTQQHFANVRGLPFHNALATAFDGWLQTGPTVDLVSQRVFDTVFRTFFIMYPAMRFLEDPLQFQAWRGRICAATDPEMFERAAYMPVTRSLSAGQRRILELWSAYVDGQLPTPVRKGSRGRRG